MSEFLRIVPDHRAIDDALHLQAELTATAHERAAARGNPHAAALHASEIALSSELRHLLIELPKDQLAEFHETLKNKGKNDE